MTTTQSPVTSYVSGLDYGPPTPAGINPATPAPASSTPATPAPASSTPATPAASETPAWVPILLLAVVGAFIFGR